MKLFVEALNFTVVYNDAEAEHPFYIVKRDGVTIHLIEDAVFAVKDRPEVRIETDDIDAFYKEISARENPRLHPNLSSVKQQPRGLRKFALKDKEGACVIIQQ